MRATVVVRYAWNRPPEIVSDVPVDETRAIPATSAGQTWRATIEVAMTLVARRARTAYRATCRPRRARAGYQYATRGRDRLALRYRARRLPLDHSLNRLEHGHAADTGVQEHDTAEHRSECEAARLVGHNAYRRYTSRVRK